MYRDPASVRNEVSAQGARPTGPAGGAARRTSTPTILPSTLNTGALQLGQHGTEALGPTARSSQLCELGSGYISPAEPSGETPTPADTLAVVSWETTKQRTQLSRA